MLNKHNRRKKRQARIRAKVAGTAIRPRLAVFRSNRGFYVQLVNDELGVTIFGKRAVGRNVVTAKSLGEAAATALSGLNISSIVFDRGGYKYHGTIKAIADAVRAGGVKV